MDVKIKEDTEAAKYSGLVQVSVNGAVISSRAVTFDVKPAAKEAPIDFVLIGIVGALLVIVIILAGFMRPKTVNRKL
ncbi:hypothetical protein HYT58_01735 [Candidatus Woesearchaeota archaeon]|nr:hypothetical protein [Candidatus Woesearchaeota archaeon]